MDYTLHQLRVFAKICEVQSITRASEELHLTQPAVSIQLKKLQDQFEIPLTEVVGRQLYVTDFGRQIEKLCNGILDMSEEIRSTTYRYKNFLTGQIKISSVSTGKYVIPYFLSEFMRLHPGVDISIDVTNKEMVVRSLQENQCDFALVSVIPDNLSLERISLMPNKLHLVGASEYIADKPAIELSNLDQHRLIFRENGSATKAAMMNFLGKNKIRPAKTMELVSNEAVKQAVLAGLGLSVMPLIGIRSELSSKRLEMIPMDQLPIITTWNLVYATGKKLNPAALALTGFIETHKTRIIDQNF